MHTHLWGVENGGFTVLIPEGTKVGTLIDASNRWDRTCQQRLLDHNYVVPDYAFVRQAGQKGAYDLIDIPVETQSSSFGLVKVTIETNWGLCQTLVRAGDFIFQAFWQLQMQVVPTGWFDDHDNWWWPDSRIWEDLRLQRVKVIVWDGPAKCNIQTRQGD